MASDVNTGTIILAPEPRRPITRTADVAGPSHPTADEKTLKPVPDKQPVALSSGLTESGSTVVTSDISPGSAFKRPPTSKTR